MAEMKNQSESIFVYVKKINKKQVVLNAVFW